MLEKLWVSWTLALLWGALWLSEETLNTENQMRCIRDCIMDLNSVSLSFYNNSDTCFGFIWPLWDSVSLYMKKR
jgi:hypothetical protein